MFTNKSYSLILASKSPRRQELLKQMGLQFTVVLKDVDESFPDDLAVEQVPVFISEKKAAAFDEAIQANQIVITADTVVAVDDIILGKPDSPEQAREMLQLLSGREHKVITGVTLLSCNKTVSFHDITHVSFSELSEQEINYYIANFNPFDKAGSYGIQDWIGLVAIKGIRGSYTNVVGLPTEKLYKHLSTMIESL